MYEEADDYTTPELNPMRFTRYYNSQGDTNTEAVTLGHNWRSTYDRYLRFSSSVIAERADGQELLFNDNGNGWASDSDVNLQLFQSEATWTLIDGDDNVETYNSAGLLTSIQARDGYTQTLTYNSANQLISVTDPYSRTLSFTYQSNLLHTVTAPSGLILTYAYNSSGLIPGTLDRLGSVTYSTTPTTSQSYLYENASLPFALTGIIDENTNRYISWTYDSSGRAISSFFGNGANLNTITYNADGSRIVTTALGLTTVYKFTTLQGVPKVTEIDRLATASVPAATKTYNYDTNGYTSDISDWNTNETALTNDYRGLPLALNEAVGTSLARSTTTTYLTNFHLPLQIVAPRKTTTFTYDTNGNPLVVTESDTTAQTVPYSTAGQTHIWTNTFDDTGHLLTSIGPRTDVTAKTTYTYGSGGNLRTITDPLGHETQLNGYSTGDLPGTMVDPNNVTTAFTYDIRNRLLTSAILGSSGDATNAFGYNAAGQLTSIIRPNGMQLFYQYDTAHRLESVSNLLGESITYQLDAAGNVTNQTINNASASIVKTQSAVFDELSRMLQQIGAYSETTSYGYDPDGNRVSVIDAHTNATTLAFDPLNRLVSVIDPLKNPTVYNHDAQDNLTSVTDPRSLVTSYVYNGFGQVIQESSPDKGISTYILDKAGNRTNEVDARGIVTVRTFDKLNRMTAETFPASSSENITNTYDATTGGNFGIGRLTGYSDETGSTKLTYNQRGDVISTTRKIGSDSYTTAYGYDIADNITNITYPSGHVISYARDSQGRISSVTFMPSASGMPTVLATSVTYQPFGPLSGFVYGNGLVRSQVYDEDYRLTGITTSGTGGSVQNLNFGYDAVNDITSINDNLASANTQKFNYDEDYRLIEAGGVYGHLDYSYDPDGNRLTSTAGNVTQNYNYSPSANMLQSTVVAGSGVTRIFAYTANGNLSSDSRGGSASLVFSYGNRNRYNTLSSSGTTIATYKHNALGERLVKTVGGVTTYYHFDEKGHLIAETQPGNVLVREYVWLDGMPLAQIEANGTVYYIHPDQLNTPQKMTSATQAIVWSFEQQPFGETVPPSLTSVGYNASKQFQMSVNGGPNYNYIVQASTSLNPAIWVSVATNGAPFTFTDSSTQNSTERFYRVIAVASSTNTVGVTMNLRFPGQYFDAESGLNYNMVRDYDPTLGRYIQNDPIGLAGGVNLYTYVNDSPSKNFDLSGLATVQIIFRPVHDTFGFVDHAFIVVTGSDGNQTVTRAGPTDNSGLAILTQNYGNILAKQESYAPGEEDYTTTPAAVFTLVNDNLSASYYNQLLLSYVDAVNAAAIPYGVDSDNSNAFAFGAIDAIGGVDSQNSLNAYMFGALNAPGSLTELLLGSTSTKCSQ